MRYREVTGRAPRFDWTDQRVDQLKRLLADGLSASEIAGEFGISRNAIIGKVHRYGLSFSRAPWRRGMGAPRAPRIARKAPLRKSKLQLHPGLAPKLPVEEPVPEHVDDLAIPAGQRRTILTLRKDDCRWPVGDPRLEPASFFYCGAPAKDGSSYCPHHDRRSKRDE